MPRAYADVIGNLRRSYAGARAAQGDYEGAMSAAQAVDPELAASYAGFADRERSRRRQDEAESANRSYADAVMRNDYGAAESVAAKAGNVEGVTAARGGRQQLDERQRMELWRGAQRMIAESEQIDANSGQGYDALRQRGLAALQQNPNMDPQMRGLIESLPAQWNPNVTGSLRTFAARLRDSLLTPEQAARLAQQQGGVGERRYTGASGGILDTFTGEVRANPHYVRGGAANSDNEAERAARDLGVTWDD